MKKLLTAREFVNQFRGDGYRKIQITKLLYVAHVIFRLELENIAVVICTDSQWSKRRNRTPLEKLAVKVGHSVYQHQGGEYQYVIFAYPVLSVKVSTQEVNRKTMASFNGHIRKPPTKMESEPELQ